MLQRLFQITSYPNVVYATGSSMPRMQRINSLPTNSFTGSKHKEDVKEQDEHKRPWYIPILHC